jgi:dihydropteroate synthase
MGVLNATPDSFSDGGAYNNIEAATDRIEQMILQGAAIIDVGGESTRPGADPVPEDEELNRVLPILENAIPKFSSTFFSIDTTKYRVAEEVLKLGVHLVNDVSGLRQEPRLAGLCSKYKAGYILMHSQGNPKTMQKEPRYDDVVDDIRSFFTQQISFAKSEGVESLILDPGIGFGKTLDHNLRLLRELNAFLDFGCPLMVGVSRKSLLGKLLNDRPPADRLTGTIVAHYHAMLQGAKIIRVHDVKEASDSILMYNALVNQGY